MKKGFTLIEMLLATVIFCWLVFFLVRIFNDVAKEVTDNRARGRISEELRNASQLMHQEMKFAALNTNANRYLNMKVTNHYLNMWVNEDGAGTYVYFCAPSEEVNDLSKAQGIRHICYFLDKGSSNIYRAVYDHAPSETTLVYQSANDPYAWIPQMTTAINKAKENPPLLSHVAYFNVLLYTNQFSEIAVPITNSWEDSSRLPKYIRLQLGIQDSQKKKSSIRNFFIEVPMMYQKDHAQ